MKDWPKSVTIAGVQYSVDYVADSTLAPEAQGLEGQIDYGARRITIKTRGRTSSHLAEVFFHELVHGIIAGHRLLQATLLAHLETREQEAALDELGRVLFDTLTRNGWLAIPKGLPKEEKR